MEKLDERQLREQFAKDFRALCKDRQPVVLQITKLQPWSLHSQVQLALRHPENIGPSVAIARRIAERIQGQVATTPALAEVARRGWDRQYDG